MSLGGWLGFINLGYLVYYPEAVFSFPPQIWRLVTGFFLTSGGLALVFDSYFLYMWLVAVETGHPRLPRRADVIWYLMFVGATILVGPIPCFSSSLGAVVANVSSSPRASCSTTTPHNICPDSALPLQLSRFLEMRKITPVLRVGPHIRIRAGLRYGHGGMSLWMARVILHSLGWFYLLPTFLHLLLLVIYPTLYKTTEANVLASGPRLFCWHGTRRSIP